MSARYEVNIDSPVVYSLGCELVRQGDTAPDEVELTDEEVSDYRKVTRAFWAWQSRLTGSSQPTVP